MPPLTATQLPLFVFEEEPKEGQLKGEVYDMGTHYLAGIEGNWAGTGATKEAAIKSAIRTYEDNNP